MISDSISISQLGSGRYRLETAMSIALPRDEVFAFFADAMQLESITPPWLHFSVLTPRPIELKEGSLLDYKLHLHRIPIRWRTEISVWDPPFQFVDTQLIGPYKLWRHQHVFEADGDATVVRDLVDYIPRGGSLIHRWFVKPDLIKIFTYRQQRLREIFDQKRATASAPASRDVVATAS